MDEHKETEFTGHLGICIYDPTESVTACARLSQARVKKKKSQHENEELGQSTIPG